MATSPMEVDSKFAYKDIDRGVINTGFTEYILQSSDYPDGFNSSNSRIVAVTVKAYNALNNGAQEFAWIQNANTVQYYLSGSNKRTLILGVLFMKY